MNETQPEWDAVVVGGGAAGLSAALVLGRARQRTLVVDAGRQSNLPAAGIGGLLGNDLRPPAEFYAAGRRELAAYPSVAVRDGEVLGAEALEDGFAFTLGDGERVSARRALLATGMEYRYPRLPGAAERWGHSVFHCPFCHGWEVRERPLGVLGAGAGELHRAILLSAWSDDVTLLTDGPAELEPEGRDRLAAAGIEIDERPLAELRGEGRELETVAFADGSERPLGGLLVTAPLHQRGTLATDLGATFAPPTPASAESLQVGSHFETDVPGLYAAGDVAVAMPSVANAIMSGSTAAAVIVGTLSGAIPAN